MRLISMLMLLAASPLLAETKPNIIYIMADDLGYGDLGCYGQKQVKTPTLDRLAEQGTKFTQFYAGCTVCAPTRSVVMTGQHTGHTWIRGNSSGLKKDDPQGRVPLRPEDVTVAEVLKKAGYATGIVGKWGLGEPETTGVPNRQGFDFWFGYLNQRHAHTYYPEYLWRNQIKYPLPGNLDGKQEQWSHNLMTAEALRFVDKHKGEPFFLYLAYTIPHAKMQIPHEGQYADKDWPEPMRKQAAMITRMDRDIRLLVERLREYKIEERTLVLFTSDNGPHSEGGMNSEFFDSNGPLRGMKRDLYEGGIRVPMIAYWPGKVPAGKVSDHIWAMWDLLPTFADLASVESPKNIDGISMVPALLGKPAKEHDSLYWEFHEGGGISQAVRMGKWKAVIRHGRPLELYDLSEDLDESDNIADKHPDVVSRIREYLKTARTESKYWPVK
jgi:arylsulfatase A-like enzyme